ncbi:hypothetical protein [Gemmatimonas sp.]|jgi:hypothetical protein|uniref:hypothetical protein n=1 Tax=Gemmatimonas sp. TaxID=1962908 RepID=UPI0037BE9780
MSEHARTRTTPESPLIERQRATAHARAWAGQVRITGDHGTVTVPGVWHLELPHEVRPLCYSRSGALTLPPAADMPAWREHLLQLVTLGVPGMQLRVHAGSAAGWHSLELAAPTAPLSVVHIDRDGLRSLLGPMAQLEMSVSLTSAD